MILPEKSWTYTTETLWLPQGITFPSSYNKDDSKLVKFSVRSETGCAITVGTDLPELLESVAQRFEVKRASKKLETCDLYYNKCSLSEVIAPCGWIDKNGSVWVQGTGVGRLKSIISAVMGYKISQNLVPIHSSMFCVNNRSYGVVGGHGAGKTQALLSVIGRSMNEIDVLTDDWAFMDMADGMKAKTFDQTATIRCGESGRKEVVRINALSSNSNMVDSISIDEFAIIMPWSDGQIMEVEAEHGAGMILSAAYHYPYTDSKLLRKHLKALTDFLRTKKVCCVPTGKRDELVEAMLS